MNENEQELKKELKKGKKLWQEWKTMIYDEYVEDE